MGDEEKAKAVYKGLQPLVAADIADIALWAAMRPPHVHIQEVTVTPTAQASVSKVVRT
jgi:NADP-dependent 3-hydroxy acid dehydrogenase YdfG